MGLTRENLQTIAVRTGYPTRAAWVAGHGTMGTVLGPMLHHTGTPQSAAGDYPSLRVVTQGRTDLRGPLCNFGLGRSGTIYLVTEGIAWHAGVGAYRGVTDGNGHFLGIEAEHPGLASQLWPLAQADAYRRLVASILLFLGRTTDWDIRHALWALPPGRKVDHVQTTNLPSMADFDARVRLMLARPETINRNWRPAAPPAPAQLVPVAGRVPVLKAGMRDPVRGLNMVGRARKLLDLPDNGTYDAALVARVVTENKRLLGRTADGRTIDAVFWDRLYGLQ